MKTQAQAAAKEAPKIPESNLPGLFALLFGLFLGLCLLKFGNPSVMEKFVDTPVNIYDWMFSPWPAAIGCGLLAIVALVGVGAATWRRDLPWGIMALPLVWLAWQAAAASQSINPALSWETVRHFAACAVCFYLGVFALGRLENPGFFLAGLVFGFLLVLAEGFDQHFGGLAQTRRYFFLYIYPNLKEFPPGYLKKMTSDRIFSTLFYPNALAGVILLLLPAALAWVWSWRQKLTPGARGFLMGAMGLAALACLYWSGSKGGWLLVLVQGFVTSLFLPFSRKAKIALVTILLVAGLAGFFLKYSGFFRRGATSVVARFDYWRAAAVNTGRHPVFGSGPGTFGQVYEKIKRPESEMSRMVHNDYLEQASDSGLVGLLAYTGFMAGVLVFVLRNGMLKADWVKLAIWLGLLGWALQGLVEFGLYIPALGWTGFALLGWLVGRTPKRVDTKAAGG